MCENSDLNKYPKFSVLMSLYFKEKPKYLRECFDSLLNQTVKADEWVIVKDGPLTDELESVLKEYETKYPNLIKYVEFEKNQGLGLALRAGVPACSYELIARMDTDDICVHKRFETQLKEFIFNPNLDICGSHIKEFDEGIDKLHSERRVPLVNKDIIQYQKRRSAYNHVTVMFKKSSVLKSGNYEDAPLMEDDMLWTRMIIAGCNGKNIDETLVYVRTGLDMISRRGGWSYFKKYRQSRKKVYQLGLATYWDYIYTLLIQFVVSTLPLKIRKKIFEKILRN